MNALENRVPPPLLLVAVALVMWVGVRLSGAGEVSPLRVLCGGVLILLGAGAVVAGFVEFRRAGTTIDPVNIDRAAKIVDCGVFAWSRNPMYVGFTLALVGWSVALGSAAALVGPVVYALFIQRFQIAPEERAMAAKFGEAYAHYRRRVRSWI